MEYKGIDYLRNRLAFKRRRVLIRYGYYDMKNIVSDFGISTPPDLRYFMGALGWCGRAVDTLADRLVFRSFRMTCTRSRTSTTTTTRTSSSTARSPEH